MKKRTVRKTVAAGLLACMILSQGALAAPVPIQIESKEFHHLVNDTDLYEPIDIKAKNMVIGEDRVTFQSENRPEDTNTYVIDKDTQILISETPVSKLTLADFFAGDVPYIHCYILKTEYYKYSLAQNEEIHVEIIAGFYQYAVGIGIQPEETEEEDFGVLVAFSMMPHKAYGNIEEALPYSRGEMAKTLVAMRNLAGAPAGGSADFSDVPEESETKGAIAIAQKLGLINGFPDGTFRPDEYVTNAQVIKMLVSVLGYAPRAEAQGGYPNGYIEVAASLGITNGILISDMHAPALRGDIARMVKTTLYLPVMVQTVFKKDAPEYAALDGTNGNAYERFYDRYRR